MVCSLACHIYLHQIENIYVIMKVVRVCYLKFLEDDISHIHADEANNWLVQLPQKKQTGIQRLVRNSDRMISLMATQLVKICAQAEGIENFRLSDVCYPDTGKPYWKSEAGARFDFNVTHSDRLVIAAASTTVKLGIDAEKIRELRNLNFKRVLSEEELEEIRKLPDRFFVYWTKKEAVVKAANTTGLERMHDVRLNHYHAVIDDVTWYLNNIELDKSIKSDYVIHLATSEPVDKIITRQVIPADLV